MRCGISVSMRVPSERTDAPRRRRGQTRLRERLCKVRRPPLPASSSRLAASFHNANAFAQRVPPEPGQGRTDITVVLAIRMSSPFVLRPVRHIQACSLRNQDKTEHTIGLVLPIQARGRPRSCYPSENPTSRLSHSAALRTTILVRF